MGRDKPQYNGVGCASWMTKIVCISDKRTKVIFICIFKMHWVLFVMFNNECIWFI